MATSAVGEAQATDDTYATTAQQDSWNDQDGSLASPVVAALEQVWQAIRARHGELAAVGATATASVEPCLRNGPSEGDSPERPAKRRRLVSRGWQRHRRECFGHVFDTTGPVESPAERQAAPDARRGTREELPT